MRVARKTSGSAVRERRILVVLSLDLPEGWEREGDPLYEGGEGDLWLGGQG